MEGKDRQINTISRYQFEYDDDGMCLYHPVFVSKPTSNITSVPSYL